MHTDLGGWGTWHHGIGYAVEKRTHKRRLVLDHRKEVEIARKGDTHRFTVTDNIDLLCLTDGTEHVGTEVLKLALLCSHEDVAIAESQCLCLLIKLHSVGHVLHRDI